MFKHRKYKFCAIDLLIYFYMLFTFNKIINENRTVKKKIEFEWSRHIIEVVEFISIMVDRITCLILIDI